MYHVWHRHWVYSLRPHLVCEVAELCYQLMGFDLVLLFTYYVVLTT